MVINYRRELDCCRRKLDRSVRSAKSYQKINMSAYTLIELLIVLALFTLITTLTIANFGFLNRLVTRTELEHLHSVCRYLQQKSLATNEKQILTFNLSDNSYTFNNTLYKLPTAITFGIPPGIKGPPATPKKVITRPITFKNNTIIFCSDGIISAGTLYLRDTRSNSIYALTSAVAQVSMVRLYRYDGKWRLIT